MITNASRTSILVLTSTFPRWKGDVEPPFVHELARRLTDSFDVHVLAPHAPGSKRREILDGVHVHRFRYGPCHLGTTGLPGRYPGESKKISGALRIGAVFSRGAAAGRHPLADAAAHSGHPCPLDFSPGDDCLAGACLLPAAERKFCVHPTAAIYTA